MAKIYYSPMKHISLPIKGLFFILLYFSVYWNVSANLVPVQSLGTTYVDNNTSGGPWVLLGYGANGNLGSLLTANNGTFDSARQGSATLDALAYARSSAKLAISWNQTGKPNGGITSYTHAVAFSFTGTECLKGLLHSISQLVTGMSLQSRPYGAYLQIPLLQYTPPLCDP